jgi:hypothetical protein
MVRIEAYKKRPANGRYTGGLTSDSIAGARYQGPETDTEMKIISAPQAVKRHRQLRGNEIVYHALTMLFLVTFSQEGNGLVSDAKSRSHGRKYSAGVAGGRIFTAPERSNVLSHCAISN